MGILLRQDFACDREPIEKFLRIHRPIRSMLLFCFVPTMLGATMCIYVFFLAVHVLSAGGRLGKAVCTMSSYIRLRDRAKENPKGKATRHCLLQKDPNNLKKVKINNTIGKSISLYLNRYRLVV